MANSNPLKAAWSEGRTTFGLWMTVPGSIGAEILAGAAVDYVCVDQQHGSSTTTRWYPCSKPSGPKGRPPSRGCSRMTRS